MPERIGRNEPCPCGSGKKYKHCCRRKDLGAEKASSRPPAGTQLDRMRTQLQKELRSAPPEKALEGRRLLAEAQDLQVIAQHSDEIDAAEEALEAHRSECEALLADPDALAERARRLFAEPDFEVLRFTPEEVERAFDATGYPDPAEDDTTAGKKMRAAILRLAGQEYRQRAALRLMAVLPKYVAAGRYEDAWLIEDSAARLLEESKESNPALGVLFFLSWQSWAEQSDQAREGVVRLLGAEPGLATGGPEGILEWARRQMDDPQKAAEVEAYIEEHPELRDQASAGLLEAEKRVTELLRRDDAASLYIPLEDAEPWAVRALEQLEPAAYRLAEAEKRGKKIGDRDRRKIQKRLVDLIREMTAAIFTPERTRQLVASMREYGRHLAETGEKDAAGDVLLVAVALSHEQHPADDMVLLSVSHLSLRAAMQAAIEEVQPTGEGVTSD